jgi:hypothetical protein
LAALTEADHVIHRGDRLPSIAGDDVAAEAEGGAVDRRGGVTALEPGVIRGTPLDHVLDQNAACTGRLTAWASEGVIVVPVMPRKACSTLPFCSSWLTTSRAVLIGIAKPMPTFPLLPPPVSIWELIPITLPSESISGPAGVAGVDRGVGLNHIRDREAVRGLDLALQRGDDAAGHRSVQAERVADRDHGVADGGLRGVAEGQRVQLVRGRVDLEQARGRWRGPGRPPVAS